MVDRYLKYYETPLGAQILKEETSYLRNHLGGCGKILDVGCGPGVFEKELIGYDIVGVDANEQMIKKAEILADNVFVCAKAEKMPFEDNSFTCVFYVTSMEFIGDYRAAVDETIRVLSDGGRILILMLNPKSAYFKLKVEEEGYISRYVNINTEEIKEYLEGFFIVDEEFFLGIGDDVVFNSDNPKYASIIALRGVLR
ncbi:MAG: hypothetical protein B6U97_00245 [Candidatus Altiarchaeales archaeon ex4484_96]|nr:MAG: hypothetical protein B6U97_00245 [Candidatus Altiarchaeales archaeon ex4484_96]